MMSWKAEAVPDGDEENDPENKKNTIKRMTSSKKNNKTSNENEENDVTVVVDGRTSSSSLTFDAVLASIKRFSLESDFELDLIRQRRFLHETPELMWNERETASFIKKELEKLKDKNPQWFETTVGKPYYTLRLATEYKETKECS